MKVLILGGAGFIGLHLARRLIADQHDVTLVDDFSRGNRDHDLAAIREQPTVTVISADLTSGESWAALAHGWDQIYLLAAVVGVRNVERDPARVVRINTLTVLHLLDWIRDDDRKIFFASTSEVYAGGVDAGIVGVPTAEDVPIVITDVSAPRFAYATSKLLGEAAFLHSATANGTRVVIGRFHNVYGPRMGADHVIPEMLLRALSGEEPFTVWGADQYRAFCYIDDAIEAMLRLMSSPEAEGQIVHIGNDTEPTNIADLASQVLDACGQNLSIRTQPAPPGSVAHRCPDLTKLRRLTGFEPKVPLIEGIHNTLAWYGASPRHHTVRRPIAFYYGDGQLDRLAGYRRVVLQAEFYTPSQLAELRRRSVEPLAYMSLTEDQGPPAPWQRSERNPDWGGHLVQVGHPGWVAHVLGQTAAALNDGFCGLFLDTLNLELTDPEQVPHLLDLITQIRAATGSAYLLANRGFGMLPQLTDLVDGILFESFSARWTGQGYAPWPPDTLEQHAQIAERLRNTGLDLYALDYADTEELGRFATRRAELFGLRTFVSDRALSRL